jgi:hypothetical protein
MYYLRKSIVLTLLLSLVSVCMLQAQPAQVDSALATEKKWYEYINLRGYVQVRYNRLLETNPKLKCEQCDRSWGEGGGFSLRRARLVFSGQIGKRIFFYFQPDFASSVSNEKLHFGQIRDAYFDIGIDAKNEFRFRIGQSKIPYGFENMQSSQNRLPLDRSDGINSAFSNERDLGVFFYWAPAAKRELFAQLIKEGLKGSGDYGIFAFGAFNGQTSNKPELNNEPHLVTRITYPFAAGDQIIEPGIQAYTGQFVIPSDQLSDGTRLTQNRSYTDQRLAASFIMYPKPWGIQAEYNIGRGPEFDKQSDSIVVKKLQGGYLMLSYRATIKNQVFLPFARVQYYEGAKKFELDARSYKVNDVEFGLEWQPFRQFELIATYAISSRRFEDYTLRDNFQKGNLLRLQAQVNF